MRLTRSIALLATSALLAGTALAANAPKKGAKDIFKARCAMCHGADGGAQTPIGRSQKIPDLRSAEAQKLTKEAIVKVITNGKAKMAPWKTKLSKDEIDEVAAFIKTLKK
jgi:mono/diheme cytochrome c family protein